MSRIFKLLIILLLLFIFLALFSDDFVSLEYLKSNSDEIALKFAENKFLVCTLFIFAYGVVCAFPIPLVAVLTVAAGVLFDLWLGLIIVSFVNAISGTFTFLVVRMSARSFIMKKVGARFKVIDREIQNNGFWYAVGMRLMPGIPFFIASAALGLTSISMKKFYFSTQLGMFITLFFFVSAGANIAEVETMSDVLSYKLLALLIIGGSLPFLLKYLSMRLQNL